MIRYTLRQLEYFVVAAECGSVAKAAARLFVSQPSVSNAIRKLEDRTRKKILLLEKFHRERIEALAKGDELAPGVLKLVKVLGKPD